MTLIFVEGFPGTGKSTTAQWLTRALAQSGRRARWVYEEEEPHPVARRYSGSERRSITEFAAAYWARWGALARAAADADEVVVLDAAFVQWPVLVLLQRDVAPDVVVEFVVRLGERLAASGARTVYTPTVDSGRALAALGERRGTSWLLLHAASAESMPFATRRNARGMAALFAYWHAHAETCDRVVAKLPMPKLVLDPATTWSQRRAAVATFIGVDPVEPEPPRGDIERCAGIYRGRGSRQEARVTVDDGRLVVDGILWPRNRLIPTSAGAFDAEGWPYTIRFVDDPAERVAGFTVSGPTLSRGRPPADFDRVD